MILCSFRLTDLSYSAEKCFLPAHGGHMDLFVRRPQLFSPWSLMQELFALDIRRVARDNGSHSARH